VACDVIVANKELNDLYEIGGACSTYGEGRGAYGVLVGKTERNRPLGRLGRRWEDDIEINFQKEVLIWPRMGTGRGLL
jgi:hypothetical protein